MLQKQIIFWGLSLLLVTPLLVANFLFFPFITGKNFFFRIIVEILTALWLSKCFIDTSWRPRKGLLLTVLSGLLLAVFVSTIFSVDPSRSFWSNFERMEGAITYIHAFLLFLIATSTLSSVKDWKRFWFINTYMSLIIAGIAGMQILGYYAVHQGSTSCSMVCGGFFSRNDRTWQYFCRAQRCTICAIKSNTLTFRKYFITRKNGSLTSDDMENELGGIHRASCVWMGFGKLRSCL